MKKIIHLFLVVIIAVIIMVVVKLFFVSSLGMVKKDFEESDKLIILMNCIRRGHSIFDNRVENVFKIIKDEKLKKEIINIVFDKKLKRDYESLPVSLGFAEIPTVRAASIMCCNKESGKIRKVTIINKILIIESTEVYNYNESEIDALHELCGLFRTGSNEREKYLLEIVKDKVISGKIEDNKKACEILSRYSY